MEPSDRHRWTNFVTFCTLDLSVYHLCHQGSNLSHCRQLSQQPSSIHTVPILQCNNGLGTICAQLTGVGNRGTGVLSHLVLTTDRPVAPTGVLRIVSCGCKTGCRKTCGCRKAGLNCSTMCRHCNGQPSSNIHALTVSQDSDDDP